MVCVFNCIHCCVIQWGHCHGHMYNTKTCAVLWVLCLFSELMRVLGVSTWSHLVFFVWCSTVSLCKIRFQKWVIIKRLLCHNFGTDCKWGLVGFVQKIILGVHLLQHLISSTYGALFACHSHSDFKRIFVQGSNKPASSWCKNKFLKDSHLHATITSLHTHLKSLWTIFWYDAVTRRLAK